MVPPPGIAVAALRRERRGRSSDSACGIRPEGTETDGHRRAWNRRHAAATSVRQEEVHAGEVPVPCPLERGRSPGKCGSHIFHSRRQTQGVFGMFNAKRIKFFTLLWKVKSVCLTP
ncbi:hypothetical protein Sfum_2100 [Syntrophobacter fumaroxidans MPOB]|uniref:Uncharacterized protein n=1 Tax=Syntrophobacter fumaroxidans (strain DSM 10017 / MPOB) TaxID=335543 RepID=A0LK31_SYNFM|nr:hypothetical protein Sfum_2100 [Syntrophobacter fumaroxidans MPOB]